LKASLSAKGINGLSAWLFYLLVHSVGTHITYGLEMRRGVVGKVDMNLSALSM